MKKIKLLFAAMAAMVAGGAYAQTDAEYADANASIQANGVYKIYTQSDGSSTGDTKYYLKTDGYLTDDASAAGQFTFDLQRIFGGHRMAGYRINQFTNGGNSDNSFTGDALKKIITTTQNRTNWEAQVFYKNGDNYAIRSTNATSSSWGASAFWTVVADNDDDGLPNATYTVSDVPYVWRLEQVTPGDYSDVTAKWIVNYEPNSSAKEEGWFVTQGTSLGSWDGHNFSDEVAEFYRRSGGGISQTAKDLPTGYYTFTAIASARANSGGTISANGIYKDIVALDINNTSAANTQFKNGNGVNTIDFALDATSDVTFALTAGTEGDAWTVYRCFYLTYNSEPVAQRKALARAKEEANNAMSNSAYDAVTGYERAQLTASVAKTVSETGTPSTDVAAYSALIDEIAANLSTFQDAPKYYTQLAAENTRAAMFGIAAQTAESQSALNAADTQAKAIYSFVTTNYNTIIDLGEWTKVNAGDMYGQHWDGTSSSPYNEQLNGWGGNVAWTTSYSQDIVLPAGDYVFKVAGRHSQNSTLELVVKNGETELGKVNDFPIGDKGRGIATDGTPSFVDGATYANNGNGRGWQWRYVPFTITEESASITISVEGGGGKDGETTYEWLSFCNYTVQSAPSVAASTIAYNQAKEAAVAARDNAAYINVQGTDRSNLIDAINADKGSTIASIDAAAEALRTATSTFTAGVADWNAYATAKSVVSSTLTYASSSKKSTLDDAVAATVNTASEAATQATAILTANRLYVESNALAENQVGAVNMTSKIGQPNAPASFGEITSWTVTDNSGSYNSTIANNEQFTQGDGTQGGAYYDGGDLWNASAYTANYKQDITLNPGKYLLTVTSRASTGTKKFELYADDATLEMTKIGAGAGSGVFDRGWNDQSLEFEINDATKVVEIGVNIEQDKEHNWYSFSRFRLVQIEVYNIIVSESTTATYVTAPEAADVTLTRTIKAGYNTVCLPFDMTAEQVSDVFGTSAVVYEYEDVASGTNSTINFTPKTGNTIDANVPVLVGSATASVAPHEFTINDVVLKSGEAKAAGTNFDFVGTYAASTDIPKGDCFIANGALYKSEGSTTIKGTRAYIHDKSGSGVKPILFIDDIETSIEEINGMEAENGVIYNLAGQRISKVQKGINIINGRKVLY